MKPVNTYIKKLLALIFFGASAIVWGMGEQEADILIHESEISEPKRDELPHKRTSPQNSSDGYRSDSQSDESDHEPEDSTTRRRNRRKKTTIRGSEVETIAVATSPDDEEESESESEDEAIKAVAAQGHHHIAGHHQPASGDTTFTRFSPEGYQNYLDRIALLNPEVYQQLIDYKDEFHNDAFFEAVDREPTVLLPSARSHGYPVMLLPDELISDEELERYLASYKALRRQAFIPKPHDFPDAEYQHYMNLIKELDPEVYQDLRNYEWQTGNRNLSKSPDGVAHAYFSGGASFNQPGHMQIDMESILNKPQEEQREYLKEVIKKYHDRKRKLEEESSDEDDEEEVFPPAEYEEYMELIKEIDPIVYLQLRNMETTEKDHQALGRDDEEPEVVPPSEWNGWIPYIDMKSMAGESKEEKIKKLRDIIKKYKEASANSPVQQFPRDEYDHYMEIIERINKPAYDALRACEQARGMPCLLHAKDSKDEKVILATSNRSKQNLLAITSIRNYSDLEESYLKVFTNLYLIEEEERVRKETPLPEQSRQKILAIIQKLAPELYSEMIAMDPTGKDHIKADGSATGASVRASSEDGLPVLLIGEETLQETEGQLLWTIGHELSHYVNGDNRPSSPLVHKAMGGNDSTLQEYAPGQKLSVQLPFEGTFKKAKSRTQEFAADRGSTMYFGTDINAGIELTEKWAKEESYDHPEKETFTRTHPLSGGARQAHLESLRDEVALHRAQGKSLPSIDWKALIREYKGKETEPTAEGDTQADA